MSLFVNKWKQTVKIHIIQEVHIANELAALMHSICGDTVICQDCAAAIAQAKAQAAPDDLILICGSLYLVGEAEEVLRADRKGQNISL